MTITVKPIFETLIPNNPDDEAAGKVTSPRYNLGSVLKQATGRLLGRVTAEDGETEELEASTVESWLGLSTAAKKDVANIFTKPQRVSFTTLTYGATVTPDLNANNAFVLTMTGNPTIANPSNIASAVGQEVLLVFRGAYQPSFGSYFKFPGGEVPTFDGALNAIGGAVVSSTEILVHGAVGYA